MGFSQCTPQANQRRTQKTKSSRGSAAIPPIAAEELVMRAVKKPPEDLKSAAGDLDGDQKATANIARRQQPLRGY